VKILLFGKSGQVGWELRRALLPLGDLTALGRQEADFERPEMLADVIARHAPDVIVNAAAYTAVDRAESDAANAYLVNRDAVGVLAAEARKRGIWLIHYSTDYVFDGEKPTPYVETDPTNPQSVYGLSKRAGEEAILASGCDHIIFRTSWVYAARGANFPLSILPLAAEKDEIRVVSDEIGSPTGAELIADITAITARKIGEGDLTRQASGIYHLVAAGETSRYDYARFVVGLALERGAGLKVTPDAIRPVPSAEYVVPAKRPANSRLDTGKLKATLGLALPPWEAGVRRSIAELLEKEAE